MKRLIKLSTYAELNDCTYRTAWNRFNRGAIKGVKDEVTSTIRVYVDVDNTKEEKDYKTAIIYARVSSNDRKAQLEEQALRLNNFATNNGFKILKSVKEVASGMNENRSKLNAIFDETEFDTLIVENKDRLTRFGFSYIERLLKERNVNIIVVNESLDDKDDLMKDFISIITSFCGRIYGRRRTNKKQSLLNVIKQ